ncbi:hypothetical protein SDRG_14172 [Saprolegnia diclina VS20]|uniref:Homeobox domain-containing protein n=1 Tax=Saprolegnia diclina (strain VS20) TaxID=1156394 RepID=T0PRG7_SAPDV|nr:hypothetical protein SDRG_14172 [Saprolegnia diclina VS20]EQC28079.1 hypothetical protein SDRG_14172 [Saprolegnia diclina VS20]|eukprot:XP_008618504.1 hypothetical protein SDRG_14172 [Saprolegnia diclina VS20]
MTTTMLVEEQKQAAASPRVKDEVGHDDDDGGSSDEKDHDENTAPGDVRKPRRELPPATVAILKTWMLSPEHVKHPYPTDEDKKMLLEKTGINMKQLTNWFTNARKRIWKPMMRREHSRQLQSSFARDVQLREGGPRIPPPPFAHDRPTDDMRDGHAPLRMAHHGGHAPDHPFSHPNDPYQGYPPPTDPRSFHHLLERRVPEYPARSHEYPPVAFPPPSGAFFEPRSHRSVSESVVDRLHHHQHPQHHRVHHPYAAPHHPIPSSFLRLPPRNERSASDASTHKPSPPLKRELDAKDDDSNGKEKRARRSSLLPPHVIRILKDWMMSPEHLEHPYPTDVEKKALCDETGLDMCQLNNWFANNRKRLWKPTMANRSKERLQLYSNESIRSIIYNGKQAGEAPVAAPRRTFTVNPSLPSVAGLPALVPPPHSAPTPSFPSMGVPREGRSHTLDIGAFRRSRMNFQDILNASSAPLVLPPLSRPGPSNSVGHEDHLPPLQGLM